MMEDVLDTYRSPAPRSTARVRRSTVREHLSKSIYLVVTGKVGISQIAENGKEVLLEIVRPDELFGESAFLGVPRLAERATADREGQGNDMGNF